MLGGGADYRDVKAVRDGAPAPRRESFALACCINSLPLLIQLAAGGLVAKKAGLYGGGRTSAA